MPNEQLQNEEQPEDPKVLEYVRLAKIFAGVGREFGFEPSATTDASWTAIARSTRYLDEVLDSGQHNDAPALFRNTTDYILNLGGELAEDQLSQAAVEELKHSREVLGNLGLGERLSVQYNARAIGEIDKRIKDTKTPKDLERWRTLEGALTAELFLSVVPLYERFSCQKFDEFAEYAKRFFSFGNNMDSMEDFNEDAGIVHQVESTLWNRSLFRFYALGSLARVMKLRGPLHNPVAAGRTVMAGSKK